MQCGFQGGCLDMRVQEVHTTAAKVCHGTK